MGEKQEAAPADHVVMGVEWEGARAGRRSWLHAAGPGAGFSDVIATPMTLTEAEREAGRRALTEAGAYDMTFSVELASEAPKLDQRTYAEVSAVWERERAERAIVAEARKRMDDAIEAYVQVLREVGR